MAVDLGRGRVAAPITTAQTVRYLRAFGVLTVLAALLVYGFLFVEEFGTIDNLTSVLASQAFIGIAAVGMTLVVITGNFVDLSVSAVIALSANALLGLADRGLTLAIGVVVIGALVVGLINGVVVGVARVNPVIVTLGVGTITAGVVFLTTNGRYSIASDSGIQEFGTSRVLGIPTPAVAFIVLIVLMQALLSLTRVGAYLRIVGSSRDVARTAGVPVTAVIVGAFVGCAAFAALAGVFLGAFTNQADLSTGVGYEFDALAAVVIGGTALQGGVGSFTRTLVGILVIGVANDLMLLEGFGTPAQLFAKGAILILAVSADSIACRFENR